MIRAKIIVAYLRLSIEDGDDRESQSIANQRKIIERYAKEHGLTIAKFYIDDGYSGYKMDRPDFNQLKHDLNEGNVDIIIVKDLSRLGRHNAKVQLFLENILEAGKQVITVSDNYDSLKEETHTMASFQTLMNEMYVKDISRKVKDSLNSLQKEGKLLCNFPYGYYKDNKDKTKCHIDHNTAPYVRQIFDMYANGMGVKEIARMLSKNNIPTPTMVRKQRQEADGRLCKIKASTDWDVSVINKILKNEFYIGTLVLNKTKTRSIKGKKVPTDPSEYLKFENHHEPIIDRHTFNLVQEIRVSRRIEHFRGKKTKKRKNLFAGIIRCADCGSLLTTSGYTDNTRYICKTYNIFGTAKCTNHVIYEQDILDALFELLEDCRNNLQEVLKDISNIIQAELKRRHKPDGNKYDLVKMLDNSKKSLETLIEMKMKEMIKNPTMSDVIDRTYSEMINTKYQEIQSLEKQIVDQQDLSLDENKIRNDANIALAIIDDLLETKNVTRKQILMLIDKLVVHEDGGLDIYLKGNLHELSHNYFKVNETALNQTRAYLYEFIAAHPDRFTKDECTLYVKDKGVKTNYKIISKIINEEIGGLIELREMRHGYRLVRPIKEVENILLKNIIIGRDKFGADKSNTIISVAERLRHNNVRFEILTNISNWISRNFNKTKKLF